MAQRVHVVLEDDIDGGDADETILFALDGAEYEIDLAEGNAEALREALAPYIGHARRVGGRRRRGTAAVSSGPQAGEIRAWAIENGYEVSSRGRVPAEIREAYEEAVTGRRR